ncbi:hypothetical protein NLM33_04205 [Bradyrhizobium sp. CCGUVB1N3]|uniref:hypothetical protein n=1 Tax=Bradyrhizobium sp. CCGUVB1N3 TaxID=2949629 RepID=UPI0020B2CE49|nr:hypothetical protein [Bradyrhizobium sp. CCGUVB1N3]MCP3469531.1 hypothetical protein [Bradyrhizobium sp. CCGUVB1N3]
MAERDDEVCGIRTASGTGLHVRRDGHSEWRSGDITLAQNANSSGTLIIGNDATSPASAPGSINAATITMGAGAAEIDFNHTSTNYVFSPSVSFLPVDRHLFPAPSSFASCFFRFGDSSSFGLFIPPALRQDHATGI